MEINNSHPIIYLRGIQYSEIESILQFIYLGEEKFYEERMNEFPKVLKYWDNLAKDVQSHYIRGPSLKQHNFNSKTYANNSKQHIHDRNTGPEHKNVNLMV